MPLPLLAAAFLKPGSIGGGDIKFMGACGFYLGIAKGYEAMILGLIFAVVIQSIFRNRYKPFALIPYLAAGCIAVL